MHRNQTVTTKAGLVLVCAWVVLLAPSGRAAEPAVAAPAGPEDARPDQSLTALCQKAQGFEAQANLAQAEEAYQEVIRRCDPDRQWELRRGALHGLRRVEAERSKYWAEPQVFVTTGVVLACFAPASADGRPVYSTQLRMGRAAEALDGKKLVLATIKSRGCRSIFEFDLGAKLETKPYDRSSEWLLKPPKNSARVAL